ncbi:MAG: hypothetical protein GYA87_03105 [Christensenellaceae bacterium]|nr:hypothetical protein [Christensenellaceae bacterium]
MQYDDEISRNGTLKIFNFYFVAIFALYHFFVAQKMVLFCKMAKEVFLCWLLKI